MLNSADVRETCRSRVGPSIWVCDMKFGCSAAESPGSTAVTGCNMRASVIAILYSVSQNPSRIPGSVALFQHYVMCSGLLGGFTFHGRAFVRDPKMT